LKLKSGSRSKYSRRDVLKAGLGVGALAATAATLDACGSAGGGGGRCAGSGPDPVTPAAAGTPAAEAQRLLSGIDTIVVVMMENRSFDHLFGSLCSDPTYPGAAHVDGLHGGESNPDPNGQMVAMNLAGDVATLDPKHDWDSSHRAYNGGRNDGFVVVNAGSNQAEAMSFHRRDTAPLLYSLADQYTVCDRWFSSVMGPTWPNRFYLHAATSAGRKSNLPMGLDPPPTVWERMADRCVPAKYYYANEVPWYSVTFPANSWSGNDAVTPLTIDHFFTDAQNGELPAFSIIDPDFGVSDGHPPHDLGLAEAFLGSVQRALAASRHWPRALLIIVFDEHGGFYDHVPPPTVPDANADFQLIGFRVPALVIGPSVRQGAVVSTPFDHVSILSTLATRFGIASLNARMDAAADLSSCIDPARVADVSAAAASAKLAPTVEVPASVVRTAHLRTTSQPEVHALAARHGLPPGHVDPRAPHERVRAWLRHAQELEALKVVG
jgi:phospholipase C